MEYSYYGSCGLPNEDTLSCEICEVLHECGEVEEIDGIMICEECCKRLQNLGVNVRIAV